MTPPLLNLEKYQDEGVDFLVARDAAILGDKPGLGKTAQAIVAAIRTGAKRILVICPSILLVNWEREFAMWWARYSSEPLPKVFLADGSVAKLKALPKDVPAIAVVNHDKLSLDQNAWTDFIVSSRWHVIVLDEAHNFKNVSAKRTKAVYGRLLKTNPKGETRWWLLSGTIAPNHAGEFYPHLRALFHDVITKPNGKLMTRTQFEDTYCVVLDTPFGRSIKGSRNLDVLKRKLAPHYLARPEPKDLPPLRFADLPVRIKARFMFDKSARNMGKAPTWFRALAEGQPASAVPPTPVPDPPANSGGMAALLGGRTPDQFLADREKAPATPATPVSRQKQAYDFFVSRGVPPVAAAGIVGNLDVESGGFPDSVISGTRRGDGGSAGYAPQFRGDRLAAFENWAAKTQQDPRSLDTQLGFVLEQLDPNSPFRDAQAAQTRDALWAAKTPEDATRIFMNGFERPNPDLAHLDRRLAAAQNVFGGAPAAAAASTALMNPAPMAQQLQPATTVAPGQWGAQTRQAMLNPQPTPGAQPFDGSNGFGAIASLLSGLADMAGGSGGQEMPLPPEQKPVDGLLPAPEPRALEPLPEPPAVVAEAPKVGLDGSSLANVFLRLRDRPQARGSLFRPSRIG